MTASEALDHLFGGGEEEWGRTLRSGRCDCGVSSAVKEDVSWVWGVKSVRKRGTYYDLGLGWGEARRMRVGGG